LVAATARQLQNWKPIAPPVMPRGGRSAEPARPQTQEEIAERATTTEVAAG
jgi:hypothetical protein